MKQENNIKVFGIKDKNINILSEELILKRGIERLEYYKNLSEDSEELKYFRNKELFLIDKEEILKRLKSEPMPYKLFRLNELYNYDLNYIGVEIDENQYYDRLGVLPPVYFKYDIYEGFYVSECITANRYEHIFKIENKYYCVIMDRQKNELNNIGECE
jgi:hypothetical protein